MTIFVVPMPVRYVNYCQNVNNFIEVCYNNKNYILGKYTLYCDYSNNLKDISDR